MIKSMTGFGRGEANDEKRNVVCEIRAVNHRYCDISVRMPRRYSFVEEKIKQAVKEKIARGKLDVSVSVENTGAGDLTIQVNPDLACQYMENLALLRDKLGLAGEGAITLEYVATLPDVLTTVPAVEDEEEITRTILAAVRAAVARLDEMRILEGEKLEDDLLSRGRTIKALVAEIETLAEDVPKTYAEKLTNRIRDLIGDAVEIPEDRIMLEAAVFADKCSIAEEITRLKSHMDHMEEIIAENGQPDGKRLDFLVQEMNREANTIGSKANDLEITGLMLKIKAEVEKIREQVQNVE